MARPWYSFYPSDYARDTGHLTLIEHGAYRVLMDHYYATAAPLPADVERLLRLCRALTPAEQDAVRFVLGEFFLAAQDGFHHPRIDAEIEKAAVLTSKCISAAKIGVAKRQRAASKTAADDAAERQPSQSQSQPQSQPQSQNKNKSDTPGFEEFWAAYPRREAMAAARRAYAWADAPAEILIQGARAYAARRQGQDAQFTKLASTWLAQECWLDDVPLSGNAPVDEAALRQAWAGRAVPLIEEIGAASFQAYFGEAEFTPGPPTRIMVAAPYLRDLIARKFSAAIQRAYGDFALEVAA